MHPVAKSVAYQALKTWIADCRIVDESGAPARVSLHQFRHTLVICTGKERVRYVSSAA